MRANVTEGDLHVQAIAGSDVVVFGFDWPEERAGELQGFALHRTNRLTGHADWLDAQKRYRSTDVALARGTKVSTRDHPVQGFQWADYTVQSGVSYTYRIVALGGTPSALLPLAEAVVAVATVKATASGHVIHFNRGAVAAQEYKRRFDNRAPQDVPDDRAFIWLSRGLLEALLAFIAKAQAGDALRVAIYEARYPDVLQALAAALARGVDVKLIYDAKENGRGDDPAFPFEANRSAVDAAGLDKAATLRANNPGYIAHNKFIVLLRNAAPTAVWFGSVNWSENGFFGQLNVGHEIWDTEIASQFEQYWGLLNTDPERTDLALVLSRMFPLPSPWPAGSTAVFSPQQTRTALDRYIHEAGTADVVMVTLAFSIDQHLGEVLASDRPGLRYVLMDGIKGNDKQKKKMSDAVAAIRATRAGRVAIGAYLRTNALDQFLLERSNTMAEHVEYIHTKFMLIDPLGKRPVVITGSANFSLASCTQNDEDMLVIVDDREVTDIYLGEFMRAYAHYAFRDAVRAATKNDDSFEVKPLNEDKTWAAPYYGAGFKSSQRTYFSRSAV